MRTASILVLCLVSALTAASVIPPRERKVADKDFLVKQKNLLHLFIRPQQQNLFREQADIGNTYDLEANLNNYRDPEVVKHFIYLYKQGYLVPREEVFSVLYKRHRNELRALFALFFEAKDYETFYKAACWARDRVNHGTFVNAFTVAIVHRPDTQDIILPPPYEVYPELFVDSTVIQEAFRAQLRHQQGPVVIPYNFTSHIRNSQDLVSYFTEDVGLNTYLTYLNYEYPTWLEGQKYGFNIERHGELFYYTRQQLLARYQLQRLSNRLPGVETFHLDLDNPVKYGYNPQLRYRNGQEVPARPEGIYVEDNDLIDVDYVKNIERRLLDTIESGTFVKQDQNGVSRVFLKDLDVMDVLGNLIEGNMYSLNRRYFKSYFLMLLSLHGHIVDPEHTYGTAPGALEHFETALRDPMYYVVIKRVLELFEIYKNQLESYTRDELYMPGVKIESVDTDKVITYYDDFEFNLNNAIEVESLEEAEKLDIRVRQQRLNNKAFTARIKVTSEKDVRVLVRLFLGPKYDYFGREFTLDEKRKYFVELDRFPYDIVSGNTVIERNLRDSTATVRDQLTTNVLLKKVDDALEGKESLYIGSTYRHCGFPERLQVPRGTKEGFPLNLYVVLSTYEGEDLNVYPSDISCGPGFNKQYVDKKPLGYPFDRIIYEPRNYLVPNIYEKDILVFHKTQEELNKVE